MTTSPTAPCPHGGKALEYVERDGLKGFFADGDTCPLCLGITPTASPASERAREAADALIDNPWSLDRRQGYREAFAAFEHRILADQASVGDVDASGSGVSPQSDAIIQGLREASLHARITRAILDDLTRIAPISGSWMIHDGATGCVDYDGVLRPSEMATAIIAALNPAAPVTQCPDVGDHIPDAGNMVGGRNAEPGSGVREALSSLLDLFLATKRRGGFEPDILEEYREVKAARAALAALSPASSAQGAPLTPTEQHDER